MDFPLKQFLSYYRPYLKKLAFVLSCAFVSTLSALLFPLLVRYITGELLEGDLNTARSQLSWVGLLMILMILIQQTAFYFMDYKGHQLGARMESNMRSELFEHVQRMSYRFFDQAKTGELMSRITNDLFMISEIYHHGPEDLIIFGMRFIGAFVILFLMNARLACIILAFLPLMALFSYVNNKKLNRAMLDNKEKIADINAQAEDSLAGVRVVHSFANESFEVDKFSRENERFYDSRGATYKAEAILYTGMDFFIQLITVAVVMAGASFILNETLNLPDLIAFMMYVEFLVAPVRRMIVFSSMLQEGITGFQRFIELMETSSDIQNPPAPVFLDAIKGEIQFQQVGFKYNKSLGDIFKNLNFTIRHGEYVALVGASGAGKTTISALIPRFYDVTDGRILIDGEDVRHLDLSFVRKNIGVVQQDVYLFSGTILENIRYGKSDATDEEVVEAAKQANAHEFILNLPHGYASEAGQRGVRLSGGQKQRISIARVFLKNPPILILDEATSALDNESEYIVKESMEKLAKGRTTVVIAHRLSTIQNAERIIVLKDGCIAEEGKHNDLIENQGIYARLYLQQFEQ